jgi:ribosomal protein S18 acetylase RimI-like enzyme
MIDFELAIRTEVDLAALERLFVAAWDGHGKGDYGRVLARSFTWVTAHRGSKLVGFVNVAWDGGRHFFLLDTTVDPAYQRRGLGGALVRAAINGCRGRGAWLHVDADDQLMERLYFPAGFTRANAGTICVEA